MGEEGAAAGCVCCFVVLVASSIMLGLSFSILNPHQVGVNIDTIKHTIDTEQVYQNGRHFLGLGREFVKFPKKMQYHEYAGSSKIGSWSKDGQEILLECGFYYKLQVPNAIKLYYKYQEKYTTVLSKIAATAIRDTTTKYNTIDFFTAREPIQLSIMQEVRKRLAAELFMDVPILNVMSIDVPDAFEAAVIDKVIKQQKKITLMKKRKTEELKSELRVITSYGNSNITVIQASANAKGMIIEANAKVEALKILVGAEAGFYKQLKANLTMNSAELLQYYWLTNIVKSKANQQLAMGFEGGSVNAN